MNKRQRQKLAALKAGPWPQMRRGRAWHDSQQRWVRLWPNHPEIEWWIYLYAQQTRIQTALKRGQIWTKKQ